MIPDRDFQHKPVLLREAVAPLKETHGKIYVDCTLGGGGHTAEILSTIPDSIVYAFDRDAEMISRANTRFREEIASGRLILIHSNYAFIRQRLLELGVTSVNGILLDAGVSSFQLDMAERGFSFMQDGPLDMRMDRSQPLTAYEVVNEWPREKLERIFYTYGEERFSRKIANRIVEARASSPIEGTLALARIVEDCLPRSRGPGPHPATRVFQAIRIAVNGELEGLEAFLEDFPELLAKGGVASVITFHSLEDRPVKERFKELAAHCVCPPMVITCERCGHPVGFLLQKKPILPSEEEIQENPRARSAKLRVFIRGSEEIRKAPGYGHKR